MQYAFTYPNRSCANFHYQNLPSGNTSDGLGMYNFTQQPCKHSDHWMQCIGQLLASWADFQRGIMEPLTDPKSHPANGWGLVLCDQALSPSSTPGLLLKLWCAYFIVREVNSMQSTFGNGTLLLSWMLPPASRLCTQVNISWCQLWKCMVYWT